MAAAVQMAEREEHPAGWTVTPCGPVLGAEVQGVRVADQIDPATAAALRALLHRYKVLFLRDLDLTHAQHLALGRVFGQLEGHPVIAHVPGYPEILDIRGAEGRVVDSDGDRRFRALDKWHSDVTFRARPSFGAVLRARELPAIGGDTLWCDAAAAYEGLSDEVKARIEGRTATHDLLFDFGDRIAPERRAALAAEFPPQHHPIVRSAPGYGGAHPVRQRELHQPDR
jgi:taurine dioxygenase